MGEQEMCLRTIQDLEAIEHVPLAARLTVHSTYELIREAATKDPERTAITLLSGRNRSDRPVCLSYRALINNIHQTANLLADLGIEPEDVIALLLPDLPETHLLLWGGQAAGIVCPIDPWLPVEQIVALLRAAKAKVLVAAGPLVSQDVLHKAEVARAAVKSITTVLQVPGPGRELDGVYAFDDLLHDYPSDRLPGRREIAARDIAANVHTRGTTATPKLVRLTHANLVYAAWASAFMIDLGAEDTVLCRLPLFHVSGLVLATLAPLAQGATTLLLPDAFFSMPTSLSRVWQIIEQERVSCLSATPSVYRRLLQGLSTRWDMPPLRVALCGGDALPVEVANAFEARTGTTILQGYGLTEGAGVSSLHPRTGKRKVGSIGLHLPYQLMKVIRLDDQGRYASECHPREPGVVAIKGPNVGVGYVQEVRQTTHREGEATDGWLQTGDLGRQDEDGYFWLTGRAEQRTCFL